MTMHGDRFGLNILITMIILQCDCAIYQERVPFNAKFTFYELKDLLLWKYLRKWEYPELLFFLPFPPVYSSL